MFVKNKGKIDFHYRKGDYLAVLKAETVSYVDENKVSAKELLSCYGQRIDIISRDLAEQIAPQFKEDRGIARRAKSTPKAVETVKKEDLNDNFIEDILKTISEPQVAPIITGAAVINEPATTDDVKVDDLGLKEANTGDKDVDDFLNGKTDKLPEGTQIISNEEAQKLLDDSKSDNIGDNVSSAGDSQNDSKSDSTSKGTSKPRANKASTKGRAKTGRGRAKKNS